MTHGIADISSSVLTILSTLWVMSEINDFLFLLPK